MTDHTATTWTLTANNVSTIKIGLLAVFIVMLCVALRRIVGMFIDGEPN